MYYNKYPTLQKSSSRTLLVIFIVAAFVAQINSAFAIQRQESTGLIKIGKDVYAILHENATDVYPNGNTGVIIGENAVMVIDACYLPSIAREDIRLIKTLTDKPIKYLAFTHWHFDHNSGASAYKEKFPDITIISEKETQKYIRFNSFNLSKMSAFPNSTKRVSLAEMEARLVQKDSLGKDLSKSEVDKLAKAINQRKNELRELDGLKVVIPNETFVNSMTLDLGNKIVILKDRGRANSPHDVTFYLPDDQILFTGDILVQSVLSEYPIPYLWGSWPLAWIDVLTELQNTKIKAMVLGHGPIQYDHQYTMQMKELLENTVSQVETMLLEGKTLGEIQKMFSSDQFRKGPWRGEGASRNEEWKDIMDVLVERTWRSILGREGF